MNMIRIGDYTHGVVLISQFGFLYSLLFTDMFSKSFIDDGFCISNKDSHFLYQSHALAFYSDTVFSLILFLMYKYTRLSSDIDLNNKLLKPVKANAFAVFAHGLGHLNLSFKKSISHESIWYSESNTRSKVITIFIMYNFWYALIKAAYLNGNLLRWRINSVIHTLMATFFVSRHYSFTYVQTVLMSVGSLSELNETDKDVYYDIKAGIIHLPITMIGYIEAVYCDSFVKKYGGHLIYDTTIPISVILYYTVLYFMNKDKIE